MRLQHQDQSQILSGILPPDLTNAESRSMYALKRVGDWMVDVGLAWLDALQELVPVG